MNEEYTAAVEAEDGEPEPIMPDEGGTEREADIGAYSGRDFKAEIDELLREYPEALSGGGLPEDVRRAALGGKNVTVAYAQSRERALKAELDGLRAQNAAAAKAPVRGMYRHAEENPADAFTRGFDSEY